MTLTFICMIHLMTMLMQILGLIRSVKRRRLYAAFLTGLLLYQTLSVPSLGYFLEEFGIDVLIKGELVALVGTFVVLITIEVFESFFHAERFCRRESYLQEVLTDPRRYLVIAGISFLIVLLITISRGPALIDSNWEALRASLGLLDALATLLQFLAFPAVWVLFRMGKRYFAALALLLTFIVFAAYGSRAALLTIPAVIGLDYYHRGLLFDKRYLLGGSAFILVMVGLLHIGGRIVRGIGIGGLLSIAQGDFTPIASLIEDPGQIDWSGGESSITYYYLFVIREGSIQGVEHLASVFRWFSMYLPRSIAPDLKPIDPTYALWVHAANAGVFDGRDTIDRILAIVQQGDMGSLHALFWGEAWMNGGFFALITMCVILGFMLVTVDALYIILPATIVSLMAPATAIGYLMVARGNSAVGLGFVAYLFPVVVSGYIGSWLFDLTFLRSAQNK